MELTTLQKELAGKYLILQLGDEEYGIPIAKVQEIIGLTDITRVPDMPDYVRGVFNLRGKVLPVVELRSKFGRESVPDTERTCIIVSEIAANGQAVPIGVLVDAVSEVLDVRVGEIDETPPFGDDINLDFLIGVANTKSGIKMLMNVDSICSICHAGEMVEADG